MRFRGKIDQPISTIIKDYCSASAGLEQTIANTVIYNIAVFTRVVRNFIIIILLYIEYFILLWYVFQGQIDLCMDITGETAVCHK